MRPGQPVTFQVGQHPQRSVQRDGVTGSAATDDRAERRDLRDRDHGAESRAEAETGHDRERDDRGDAPEQRASGRERSDALPPAGEMFAVLNQSAAGAPAQSHPRARRCRVVRAASNTGTPGALATAGSAPVLQPVKAVTSAMTIDSLFAPLPTEESRAMVCSRREQAVEDDQASPWRDRCDPTPVLNDAEVPADAVVVTAMTTGLTQKSNAAATTSNSRFSAASAADRVAEGRGGGRGF